MPRLTPPEGGLLLLRATYILGRQLLAPLREADIARHGHQAHRLRVLLASLSAWLAHEDPDWLAEQRDLDLELHRHELCPGADSGGVRDAWRERAAAALRSADALTFALRELDLDGAALLTRHDPHRLRAAIDAGELRGAGPLHHERVTIADLFDYARAHGLDWADGLDDDTTARAQETELRARLHQPTRQP
jgi:hypothetical protein